MKKDTAIFMNYVRAFSIDSKSVCEKYSINYRHFPYLLHSYGAKEEVRVKLISFADRVIKTYFAKNSKASFLRMVSDTYWNRKPFFSYNLKEDKAEHAYCIFLIQRIVDFISSDNVKMNKLMSKAKGLWLYLCVSKVSTAMISRASWKNMLKSKDSRVLGFAIKKAPAKQLIAELGSVKIKNKSILRKYNKRMRDLNISSKILLSISMFARYYDLANLRNSVSKDNAKDILNFYSNNQIEITKSIGNNHWLKSSMKDLIDKCTSMISDDELFSYLNIDIDTLYKRSSLKSIVKI